MKLVTLKYRLSCILASVSIIGTICNAFAIEPPDDNKDLIKKVINKPHVISDSACTLLSHNGEPQYPLLTTLDGIVITENNTPKKIDAEKLSETDVIGLIDAIFDADTVSNSLISKVNSNAEDIIRNKLDVYIPDPFDFTCMDVNNTAYPADGFYGTWNPDSPHPYSSKLFKTDTNHNTKIQLTDSLWNCNYHHPILLDYPVTSGFGKRNGKKHEGTDIDLEVKDPVHAAFSGMVRYAKMHKSYGRLVIIRHYNGLETYYAHLHALNVHSGDIVEAGDIIGLGGSSGRSTGSHLHFEVRYKGIAINANHIISFGRKKLRTDKIVLNKRSWGYTAKKYIEDQPLFNNTELVAQKSKEVHVHTIQSGDYLAKIAKLYGTTIESICTLNNISKKSFLRIGKKLKIVI